MEYKVLIRLYVPEIEQNYEVYIPINKTISQVLVLLNKLVNSVSNEAYPIKNDLTLYNRRTFEQYNLDSIIRNTNIRNGTEIVMK